MATFIFVWQQDNGLYELEVFYTQGLPMQWPNMTEAQIHAQLNRHPQVPVQWVLKN
jgi:hypothetical protein